MNQTQTVPTSFATRSDTQNPHIIPSLNTTEVTLESQKKEMVNLFTFTRTDGFYIGMEKVGLLKTRKERFRSCQSMIQMEMVSTQLRIVDGLIPTLTAC